MKENIVEKLTGEKRQYITLRPRDLKRGHGGSLSVKIVLPCYCQAKCPFCFNKQTINTQSHDYNEFFSNLNHTLDMIFKNIKEREITLDITGNEPTFDIEVFKKLMDILKKYKSKTKKIVLTTNGFKLKKCIINMIRIVDIVNISVHHYNFEKRKKIFGTSQIPSDEQLKEIVQILKEKGITSTAVTVLYKKIDNFKLYYEKFKNWAIDIGFKDVRMRSNFCKKEVFFNEIIENKMGDEKLDIVEGLTTKIIFDRKNNFKTYIFKGVLDLTKYNIGAELVIDDDGKCYVDYSKRYMVDKNTIDYFNKFYVLK